MLKYKKPWVRAPTGTFKPTDDPNSGSYLPAVPHLDLTITELPNSKLLLSQKISNLLENPMIKCKQANNDMPKTVKAFASGKRSALLVDEDGNFIRLKGCGNLDQGFPVEPMPFPMDSIEVRGCQF